MTDSALNWVFFLCPLCTKHSITHPYWSFERALSLYAPHRLYSHFAKFIDTDFAFGLYYCFSDSFDCKLPSWCVSKYTSSELLKALVHPGTSQASNCVFVSKLLKAVQRQHWKHFHEFSLYHQTLMRKTLSTKFWYPYSHNRNRWLSHKFHME